MKRSEELKIKRTEKVDQMSAILEAATTQNNRALSTDENTQFTNMKAEVTALDAQITDAEFVESRSQEPTQKRTFNVNDGKGKIYNIGKAIREFAKGEDKLTGIEAEQHQELSRTISSTGLLIPRSATVNTATTHATSVDVAIDPNLSILGYNPLWNQMGLTVLNGLQGTVKLGKKTHDVAGTYAETDEVVAESNIPSYVTLAPERYGITDIFTKELLAQENPSVQAAIVADMVKASDRKITADVYTKALAAASEVAAGALTPAGFDALMAAVDMDGAFAMNRTTFFACKNVKVDSGSGILLVKPGMANGIGNTHDGTTAFYSQLFADGANKQYVVYGAWAEMYLGFWGALEIMLNPYTYQKYGEIELTINQLASLAVRNTGAFKKSPDLDATT